MTHVINSRFLGKRFTFTRPSNYYIYCDGGDNKKVGTLGYQICQGGALNHGSTIGYKGDDEQQFKRICNRWFTDHLHLEGVL